MSRRKALPPASSINTRLRQNGPVERYHRVNMLLCPRLGDTDSIDVVLLSFYSTFDRDNARLSVRPPHKHTHNGSRALVSNQSQIYYITYTNAFTKATNITYKPNVSHQTSVHLQTKRRTRSTERFENAERVTLWVHVEHKYIHVCIKGWQDTCERVRRGPRSRSGRLGRTPGSAGVTYIWLFLQIFPSVFVPDHPAVTRRTTQPAYCGEMSNASRAGQAQLECCFCWGLFQVGKCSLGVGVVNQSRKMTLGSRGSSRRDVILVNKEQNVRQ